MEKIIKKEKSKASKKPKIKITYHLVDNKNSRIAYGIDHSVYVNISYKRRPYNIKSRFEKFSRYVIFEKKTDDEIFKEILLLVNSDTYSSADAIWFVEPALLDQLGSQEACNLLYLLLREKEHIQALFDVLIDEKIDYIKNFSELYSKSLININDVVDLFCKREVENIFNIVFNSKVSFDLLLPWGRYFDSLYKLLKVHPGIDKNILNNLNSLDEFLRVFELEFLSSLSNVTSAEFIIDYGIEFDEFLNEIMEFKISDEQKKNVFANIKKVLLEFKEQLNSSKLTLIN